ncbi:MAG: AmmeMemoRadiSam system protein A [Propionibacteriaceae bacterium]
MSDLLPPDAGSVLCAIARRAIAARLGLPDRQIGTVPAADRSPTGDAASPGFHTDSWLQQPGAAFVTLTKHGALRGCIGSLSAHRPLRDDVVANAVNAATHDPRFPPLTHAELAETHIEVSVLSAPQPLPFANHADAVARLRPRVDGVILEYESHRGTFLPQVWDQLPHASDFLSHLVRKAGLPAGWWDDSARLSRYTVTAFEET